MNTGLTFIPKFVKQHSNLGFGEKVTHENYNEKLNLNTTQGDYNTDVLLKLLTNANPEHTYHIPYLDDSITNIETTLGQHQTDLEQLSQDIGAVSTDVQTVSDRVTNIENGTTTVVHATTAEHLEPSVTPSANQYYGTDANANLGFVDLPDFLYAIPMESSTGVDGVYYTPAINSVAETMLTPEVRYKLNRETNTDYDYLDNRPSINSILLTGNKSLSDLGIQPVGSYVTTSELTNTLSAYATIVDTQAWVNDQLANYATTAAVSSLSDSLSATTTKANNAYDLAEASARIYVNQYPAQPKEGDLYIEATWS